MNGSMVYGALSRLGKVAAVLWVSTTSAWAEQTTIVAFGDSLTQGYGLIEQEGFVPQMRGWLAAQGADVKVINAGVSGDTTAGGLARAAWTFTDDIDGMILCLGGNDVLRGLDPAVSRANLTGILEEARQRDIKVLLVGMQAPNNYGAEYKQTFDSMYPALAKDFDTLFAESFLGGLGEDDPAKLQGLMQADGIHPNKAGVAKIVAALGPDVLALISAASE
ncbi:arylesterase [Shimia litoralis]|nr:arylesterase [Shimia litoralis]